GDWGRAGYPGGGAAVIEGMIGDPLFHLLQVGLKEGRSPSAATTREIWSRATGESTGQEGAIKVGDVPVPLDWPVGGEIGKTFALRLLSGFFGRFFAGRTILDIGFRGADPHAIPVLPHAIGVDLDFPGYDGLSLPFADNSVDTVFASHVLEHVAEPTGVLRDWFRVLKVGGYLVCIVPHQFLYERKQELPSQWSAEHLRFYTPG